MQSRQAQFYFQRAKSQMCADMLANVQKSTLSIFKVISRQLSHPLVCPVGT